MNELLVNSSGIIHSIELSSSYPDGMPYGHTAQILPYRSNVTTWLLRPKSLQSFMAAMFIADAWRDRGMGDIDLILPFVPGGRQDRLSKYGDFLFTVKSIAREINLRGFRTVTIVDPHSDVTPALIDRCSVISASDLVNASGYAAIVAPDAGASKRAGAIAKAAHIPLLQAWKSRDVRTGEISGFGIQSHGLPIGSKALVVDDICDGGGTFIGLHGELTKAGLVADLWTTHGIYSKGTGELRARFGKIMCADTIVGASRVGIEETQACVELLKAMI